MRAEFSRAKRLKRRFWTLDIAAAGLSIAAALITVPIGAPTTTSSFMDRAPYWIVIALVVVGVALKVLARLQASASRGAFRVAERARRYDFESQALGWATPPLDHADLLLAFSPEARQAMPAADDEKYYGRGGPPSLLRFLCNLAEASFFTEKLHEVMAKRRAVQLALAILAFVLALVFAVTTQGALPTIAFMKLVSVVTVLFVSLDVFGEMRAFARGERDVRAVEAALIAELGRPAPSRDAGIRLFIEYNCILAEMPFVPDAVYDSHRARLNEAWGQVEKQLPATHVPTEDEKPS